MNAKGNNIMRVLVANVNGLNINEGWCKWNYTYQRMKEDGVDIVGLCETNTKWDNNLRYEALREIKQFGSASKLATSTSSEITSPEIQRGGTSLSVQKKLVGRVTSVSEDKSKLGRWTYVRLQGKGTEMLTIMAVYRSHKSKMGDGSSYSQQRRLMRIQGIKNPDPRKQFMVDLVNAIRGWNKEGEILVMGGFNSGL